MEKKYNGYKASLWLICLGIAIILGASFFQLFLTEKNILTENPAMAISQFFLIIPIAIGFIYLKKYNNYSSSRDLLGINGFDPVVLLLIIFLPLATEYFGLFMELPYIDTLNKMFGEQANITAPETVSEMLWMFTSLCILAPVLEELLFRGIIMSILSPYGTFTMITLSAIGFAALHFSPPALIVLFVVGIVLGFTRLWTNSIFPCMIFHSIFNFSSLLMIIFNADITSNENAFGIFAIIMACLFPVLMLIFYKCYGKGKWYRSSYKYKKGAIVPIIIICLSFALISVLEYYAQNGSLDSGAFEIENDFSKEKKEDFEDRYEDYYDDFFDNDKDDDDDFDDFFDDFYGDDDDYYEDFFENYFR